MEIPLLDAIDLEILMHRDVHFGGSFSVMLEYYEKDGVGVMPDFELSRIAELQTIEESSDENLNEKILPMPAIEEIQKAKDLYLKIRDVYEQQEEVPILLSDLILSEEENPEKEILAIVGKGKTCVAPLIQLIESSDFYNPLFPGYGRAPALAAQCLAKIGDPSAIAPIFNALGNESFATDEAFISALVHFSEVAKDFLLKRIQHKPHSKDNDNAAIVLTSFPPDEEIAQIALLLLGDKDTLKHASFSSYLICCCEGLKTAENRSRFISLGNESFIPTIMKSEFKMISKTWD